MKSLSSPLFLCLLLSASLHAQTPGDDSVKFRDALTLSDADRKVLTAFVRHAANFGAKQTAEGVKAKCLKSPESFAWVDFRFLNCLNVAYELTGDTAWLDRGREAMALYLDLLSTQHDAFLGWYGSPIPARIPKDNPTLQIDEIQMNFRAISVLAGWVELARQDKSYADQNARTIERYLDLMEKHLFPKWDARGFYADVPGAGVYRGLDFPIEGGPTLSHEKLSIIVDGLLSLHRVTNNPLYMQRAIQIGAWFKRSLALRDGHYEWMSWCPAGAWDVSTTKPDAWKIGWIAPDPNGEWYVAAVSIAMSLYRHGVLFTDEDVSRFVRTQREMCWNGDMEKPEYRSVSGGTGKFIKGRFLSHQVAQHDPDLSELAFFGPHEADVKNNTASDWRGGANAQQYIREKYLMRPLIQKNPQPYAHVGEAFLSVADNQRFYDSYNFAVEAPGAVTPAKPSEARFIAP